MPSDRGVAVDDTTLFRWVQAYAATPEQRTRHHLRPCTGSWRVDETYIMVKGIWTYLYRAVDNLGQTIDFLLSAQRSVTPAKRFFRKALAQPHTVNSRTITVDKNPAYPRAVTDLKRAGELWRFSRLRQRKYLNNIERPGGGRARLGPVLGTGPRRIQLPQLLALALPPATGQAIVLLKESAVLSVITVPELTFQTTRMVTETLAVVEPYFALARLYWSAAFLVANIGQRAEAAVTRHLHLQPGR